MSLFWENLRSNVSHDVSATGRKTIAFDITGTTDVKFKPTDFPNQDAWAWKINNECYLGIKAFIVVGGKLNINAFPTSCSTHTPVLDTIAEDIVPNPDDFLKFNPLPDGCQVSGIDFIKYEFDDADVSNWSGWWGSVVSIENEALKITNHQRTNQSPYIDITELNPADCVTANKKYMLSVRIKLDKVDGGGVGGLTLCMIDGTNCAYFGSNIDPADL